MIEIRDRMEVIALKLAGVPFHIHKNCDPNRDQTMRQQ
jgi:hypothetical protein